ncbi:hypothetical protein CFC21_018326 [Triticum aestivum]|uniref:Uncharacterized protein n=2 Tax=Triticum aestivum TaxID=4565 RepID=A0A3B6B2U8_WHEAT|nr:hypothetical protein CFC21_018326 [Triticum aestivum]
MKHCRTADVGGASLQPHRSFQRPPRRFTATSSELHCNLAGAPTTAVALHCNLAGASLQPQCSMVAPRRPPAKLHCSVTTTTRSCSIAAPLPACSVKAPPQHQTGAGEASVQRNAMASRCCGESGDHDGGCCDTTVRRAGDGDAAMQTRWRQSSRGPML